MVNSFLNNLFFELIDSKSNSGPLKTSIDLFNLKLNLSHFKILFLDFFETFISSFFFKKYESVILVKNDLLPKIDFTLRPPEIAI